MDKAAGNGTEDTEYDSENKPPLLPVKPPVKIASNDAKPEELLIIVTVPVPVPIPDILAEARTNGVEEVDPIKPTDSEVPPAVEKE